MKSDIIIIGGGIMGSAAAYFFGVSGRAGDVTVIEPDPTYAIAPNPPPGRAGTSAPPINARET